MIAYLARYRSATNKRGSYYLVTDLQTGKRHKVDYDYSADNAARTAVETVHGRHVTYAGSLADGSVYVGQDYLTPIEDL